MSVSNGVSDIAAALEQTNLTLSPSPALSTSTVAEIVKSSANNQYVQGNSEFSQPTLDLHSTPTLYHWLKSSSSNSNFVDSMTGAQLSVGYHRDLSSTDSYSPPMTVPFAKYAGFRSPQPQIQSGLVSPVLPRRFLKRQSNLDEVFLEDHTFLNSQAVGNSLSHIHPADQVNFDSRVNSSWSSSQTNAHIDEGMPLSVSESNNTTENVRVSSSFHVAEIVGKQGVKIKKIRANTNTWIKTPARAQDPVFIISGRREGVEKAKAEILASNAKVSKLRELRQSNPEDCAQMNCSNKMDGATDGDAAVVLKVTVPSNAVGLVIGLKGARVREITETTNTYIKTPRRYREPIFEIYGHPTDVLEAKERILDSVHQKYGGDEYLQQWMTQLPIHEPGSPVLPGPEIGDMGSPGGKAFTKLRPFPVPSAPGSSPIQSGSLHVHPSFMHSYPSSPAGLSPNDGCYTMSDSSPMAYNMLHNQIASHAYGTSPLPMSEDGSGLFWPPRTCE